MNDKHEPASTSPSDLFPIATAQAMTDKPWVHKLKNFVQEENFHRFFRFGALDQNILLLGLLTGVGIDGFIHKRFGVAGYGPIIGAGVSNWMADGIATLPEGYHATAGITLGTLLPMLPIVLYMGLRRNFNGSKPPAILVGTIVGSIFGIFGHQWYQSRRG